MKTSVGILLTGALLIAPVPLSSVAVGQAQNAAAGQEQNSGFEFYGEIEAGWREFIKRPPSGYGFGPTGVPLTAKQIDSRAKFEQYGEIAPGFFLDNLHLGGATKDSGFVFDFWAKDAGRNNQNYLLQLSHPGRQYWTFEWDELPHLYSSSGKTLFDTSNRAALTVPNAVQSSLAAAANAARGPIVNANLRPIELSVQRDTAKVAYRFTPSPAWDFRADYSDEMRTGTMPFGTAINGFNTVELPAPVSFRTQNFSASGQYFNTYANNKKFNISLAYAGSIFNNEIDTFTWDNPYRLAAPVGNNTANIGRNSLPPDNHAHRFTLTGGIDLPHDSRYMGTVAYSMMRQNDLFMPKTINPTLLCGGTACSTQTGPTSSLHGAIDTLLFNNVLTTRLSKDLTSTLRYRYYDNNNRTPILFFTDYVRSDGQVVTTDRQNLPIGYIRQNAGADLNWRAKPWLTMGGSYNWERYDRDRRDVDVTNEHSGKVFTDASPWDWVRLRASYLQAQRRFDEYNILKFVGSIAYPPLGADFLQNPLIRKFDMTDRDRSKADLSIEFMTPIQGLIVTPTFSWRHDEFSDNSTTGGDLGLKDEKAWNAGVEVAYTPNARIKMLAYYMYEEFERALVNRQRSGGACPTAPPGSPNCNWGSKINDIIHTFYGSVNVDLVPGKLDLKLGYTFSQVDGKTNTYALGSAGITSSPQFPDVTNRYHRFDAVLSNKLDEKLVRLFGWKGDVTAKLRYTFESNSMTNWAIDDIVPYMFAVDSGSNNSLFLASINPNYSAHIIAMTLAAKW